MFTMLQWHLFACGEQGNAIIGNQRCESAEIDKILSTRLVFSFLAKLVTSAYHIQLLLRKQFDFCQHRRRLRVIELLEAFPILHSTKCRRSRWYCDLMWSKLLWGCLQFRKLVEWNKKSFYLCFKFYCLLQVSDYAIKQINFAHEYF